MKIKRLENLSDTFDLQFPEHKPFDVVGFGTNSVDYLCTVSEYPEGGSKTGILHYEKLPGGQVATAITFLSHMGLKTKYIGKVGGDELGSFLLSSFKSESVDASSVLMEPDAQNQFAFIVIDEKSGERTVMSRRDDGLNFRESELKQDEICAGRILHLDGYDSEGSLRAARWCRAQGIPVSIDLDTAVPNCRELIQSIDFLIVSSNFPSQFTGIPDPVEAFDALHRCYDGFLAITLGAAGANAWVGNRCISFPGAKVSALDTTGAGDIFHGAFIYGLLQNWPLVKIMSFANSAAALSCGYLGARTGIRSLSEILQHAGQAFL
jgi:sugar/nucleoside kinase (ribokinase family)